MPQPHRVHLRRTIHVLTIAITAGAVAEMSATAVAAAPTIKITASTRQARKGQPFHIYVTVESDEPLELLEVTQLAVPTGFRVVPESQRIELLKECSWLTST